MDFKCDELILGKKDADSRALTSRLQTTCLGAEASDVTAIRQRAPRVVANESTISQY